MTLELLDFPCLLSFLALTVVGQVWQLAIAFAYARNACAAARCQSVGVFVGE